MTEILTESYCERCGAKFTFESAAAAGGPLTRALTLVRGLRNYVTSDESLDEALAEARREEERQASGLQLRAFHETFNFCFSCRQYTCRDCWNEGKGRCRSCAPLPDLPDPLELRGLSPESAQRPAAHLEPAPGDVSAWPTRDLGQSDGGTSSAGETPAQARPAPLAPAEATEPLATTPPVQRGALERAVEPRASEPVDQPVGPAPAASTPAAPPQPTAPPQPAAPPPWPRMPVRPPQPPAQAPAPWQIVAPDEPPSGPAGPPAQPRGVRERPVAPASPIGWMLRHRENAQPQVSPRVTRSVWDESARDIVSRPGSGVQACQGCGLPLSATARFCRRCGARQT